MNKGPLYNLWGVQVHGFWTCPVVVGDLLTQTQQHSVGFSDESSSGEATEVDRTRGLLFQG